MLITALATSSVWSPMIFVPWPVGFGSWLRLITFNNKSVTTGPGLMLLKFKYYVTDQ